MPVNEAIELHRALDANGLPQGALFLNAVFAPAFTAQERTQVARGGPLLAAAADAADAHEARADLSVRYEQLLRKEISLPLVTVPYLFDRTFRLASVDTVARAIEAAL
jgi:hypothetical protein